MPIEFECPGCHAILRVPDDAAGKQAQCPRCDQVVTVLGGSPGAEGVEAGPTVPPPPLGEQPSPPGSPEVNPYAPPQVQTSFLTPVDRGVITPQTISFEETFKATWRLFLDNFGPFVGMGAILFGIGFASNLVMNVASFIFIAMEENVGAATIIFAAIELLFLVFGMVLNAYLQAGMLRYSIELAKGMRPAFGRIFLPINQFFGFVAVSFLLWLIVFAGLILLIIPGIILMLMFFCAPAVYLDGKGGILESFGVSRTITRGNRLTIFALFVVNSLLLVLATLVTCGLAAIVGPPFFALLTAVIYTHCAGLFGSARPPLVYVPAANWTPPASPGPQ